MPDSSRDNGPTDAEIEALIRDAYAGRLDPEDPDKAEARLKHFCYHGPAKQIAVLWETPLPDYEWSAARLEEASDLGEIDLDESRVAELVAGAAPTEEEQAYLREAAEAVAVRAMDVGEVAYVYYLAAPEGSVEARGVFFVWTGLVCCQESETHAHFGPLCGLERVRTVLARSLEMPIDFHLEQERFPEREELEAFLLAGKFWGEPAPEDR